MRSILLTLFVIPFFLGTSKIEPKTSVVVLELFTSQGCSSCPAADALVEKVSNGSTVIGLSYHVDYWNHIGWKDPFSKAIFSAKQRAYGSKFYSSSIYTPQVVINGREHFVGSDARKMQQKIKEYASKSNVNTINISNVNKADDVVNFDYSISGEIKGKALSVILVLDKKITSVIRGENRNRTLINSNIVIAEEIFSVKKSAGKGSIRIPKLTKADDMLSLVLVTKTKNQDVTGAVIQSL